MVNEEKKVDYDYDYRSQPKLTQEFKDKYTEPIKGKETIKAEGLTILGHDKGIWKLDVDVLQFPTNENGMLCICKATVGGYDWDPIKGEVREVIYSDIADASPSNCTSMVAKSFVRMASTRAISRALRKYTNVDMLSSAELEEITTDNYNQGGGQQQQKYEEYADVAQLTEIKRIIGEKRLVSSQEDMQKLVSFIQAQYGKSDFTMLTKDQANDFIAKLNALQVTAQ